MADNSDLEKSELPTKSKLSKAKEKGQIPRSRELSSMVILLVGVAMLGFIGDDIGSNLTRLMRDGMAFPRHFIGDESQMVVQLVSLLSAGILSILPFLIALVIAALIAPPLVGGLLFSPQSLKFDITKLSPIAGIKKIFSVRIFAELLKSVLKITLISVVTAGFLSHNWQTIIRLTTLDLHHGLAQAMQLLVECGLLIIASLAPMVGFDIFYQLWSNLKKLKMSKQEIKDEYKEQEGDPEIKARVRQLQQAIAKRRMMDDVPNADVIVTNPTHYAIALRYDEKSMPAPKVIAKGAGHIAQKIKQLGYEHNIVQLEAPPLARSLYRHAELGETIPAEFYAAVAQVLAWVYQLKRWYRQGGTAPIQPHDLPVPDSLDFGLTKRDRESNE